MIRSTARELGRWCLRGAGLVAMAVWFGGFTFYAAVVVPTLHESFESLTVGGVTRQVTWVLNAVGVVTVTLWGLGARPPAKGWLAPWSRSLWATTAALLAVEIGLHVALSSRIDRGAMRSFYPLHRAYLWVSTLQWLANVGLLASIVEPPGAQDLNRRPGLREPGNPGW